MSSLERRKSFCGDGDGDGNCDNSTEGNAANADAPTSQSCRVLSLPRPRRISSGRSDGSLPPPPTSSDIRADFKAESSSSHDGAYERRWNVPEEWGCLPRVPQLYVLETTRTVVEEESCGSPAEVGRRIVDCLRVMSLDAAYDHGRAKAFATSSDGVEFFVRLFRHASSIEKRGIIVEIQRKRGSALRFHRLARAVLRAARGDETNTNQPSELNTRGAKAPGDPPRPVSGSPLLLGRNSRPASLSRQLPRPQLSASPMTAPTAKDPKYALEKAGDLLRKDRTDAQELGMESIALLTDEESSGAERALGVAQVLLLGLGGGNDVDEEERYASIQREIVDLIIHHRGDNSNSEEEEMDDSERRHQTIMRRLAMTALGNSLATMSRSSPATLANLLAGWAGLLPALMRDVGRAEESPHDAALAVRCLSALLGSGSAAIMTACKAADEDMREKLAMAKGVGRCRHSMLESESERALLRLL